MGASGLWPLTADSVAVHPHRQPVRSAGQAFRSHLSQAQGPARSPRRDFRLSFLRRGAKSAGCLGRKGAV